MANLRLMFLILTLFSTSQLYGDSATDLVGTHDLRSYNPVNYDLKDLTFDMSSAEITDEIKKQLVGTEIKEVILRFYWLFPGKVNIEVVGLPRGFFEIKNRLKGIALQRLDFVIPKKLNKLLDGYKLKLVKKRKEDTLVSATDETNTKSVNNMKIYFDTSGKLKMLEASSPAGFESFQSQYNAKNWSHNKWVLDKLFVKSIMGLRSTKTTYEIKYGKVAGMGFPNKIIMSTESQMQYAGNRPSQKNNIVNHVQEFNFSNYKVNQGLARQHFRKNKD